MCAIYRIAALKFLPFLAHPSSYRTSLHLGFLRWLFSVYLYGLVLWTSYKAFGLEFLCKLPLADSSCSIRSLYTILVILHTWIFSFYVLLGFVLPMALSNQWWQPVYMLRDHRTVFNLRDVTAIQSENLIVSRVGHQSIYICSQYSFCFRSCFSGFLATLYKADKLELYL